MEIVKRLYIDFVDCVYDDFRFFMDCGNMVICKNEGGFGDIFKCFWFYSEVFVLIELIFVNGVNSIFVGDN